MIEGFCAGVCCIMSLQENEITDVLLERGAVGWAVKMAIRIDISREQSIKLSAKKKNIEYKKI